MQDGPPVDWSSVIGMKFPNGNILAQTDSVMGTWSFGYDSLNRLTSAQNTAVSSTSSSYAGAYGCWTYDSFGNRWREAFSTATTTPCASGANDNMLSTSRTYNSLNRDTGLTYDGAGNVKADLLNQYLYDGEGRLCAVKNSNSSYTQYVYDAKGRRVAKGALSAWPTSCNAPTAANGFTLNSQYLLNLDGEAVTELNGAGAWQHSNVHAGGTLATYASTASAVNFQFTDPLGTRRVLADATGNVLQTCLSLPFGNGESCPATPTEQLFTGKERDGESGNDYFGARYYSSSMGRFMSPDPNNAGADINNPQSWNMYSYALNNPLINTDPTGLDCVYMNDNNDGVESIDHNSNSGECGDNGGTWRDGWVGSGQVSVGQNGNVNIGPVGKACIQAAFRGMIAHTEGTDSLPNGGYGSLAQGGTVSSAPPGMSDLVGMSSSDVALDPSTLSGHPNIMVHLPRRDGSFIPTSAFGRYQIMARTAAGYGFTDFSPSGQDAAANTLMDKRHMISPAMNGDLSGAISRGANEWASLPGNDYGQGGKSMADAQAAYNQSMASAPECQ